MNKIDNFYNDAIEKWRLNAGIGTMLINRNTNPLPIILGIIQRIYNRSPCTSTLIVVKDFNTRSDVITFLTNTEDENNNEEIRKLIKSKNIFIFTNDYMNKFNIYRYPSLTIILGSECINDKTISLLSKNNYKLCVLNSFVQDKNLRLKLYDYCPMLSGFNQNEVAEFRANSPVEEMFIRVDVTDEDTHNKIEDCNRYISQSMSIFGNYETMLKARMGDRSLNISAAAYCTRIAQENGWSDSLDMSVFYNVEIDKMYNPNALNERACVTSDVIKERARLVTNYLGKLPEIHKIVEENKDSKILIISKKGEFANEIVEYLNQQNIEPIAGGYNDKMDPKLAYDSNGNPITYRSGDKKGKTKILGTQAQSTNNLKAYNNDVINVLCTGNAPDKKLNCIVNIVIITSSLCDNIEDYIYRLNDVSFPTNPIKVYTMFCKNTIEEKALSNRHDSETHIIVNKNEISAEFDKNLGFVLAD